MDTSNKYCRQITGRDVHTGKAHTINVDVYRVLDAFDVRPAALQHLAKKALCAGIRGHKDQKQDLLDIKQSIEQALDQLQEKDDQTADVHPHDHQLHIDNGSPYRKCDCCPELVPHWQRVCENCIPPDPNK